MCFNAWLNRNISLHVRFNQYNKLDKKPYLEY